MALLAVSLFGLAEAAFAQVFQPVGQQGGDASAAVTDIYWKSMV
jgi:hypothetical protein